MITKISYHHLPTDQAVEIFGRSLGRWGPHLFGQQTSGTPDKIRSIPCWLLVSTPLKNMKVNWDDYSQIYIYIYICIYVHICIYIYTHTSIYGKLKNVPNHQPAWFVASSKIISKTMGQKQLWRCLRSLSPSPNPTNADKKLKFSFGGFRMLALIHNPCRQWNHSGPS